MLHFQVQKFANQLLGDKYQGRVSKLDALVIGHVVRVDDAEDEQGPIQQHCFIKGEQRDGLDRTVVVGVPVTRMLLRETHPFTNILDVDPVPSWDPYWDRWAGIAM
jgi:hypothetical protein